MDIIDNGSDNGQSDDTMTELDPEDNQQTLQQESVTELATVVPISYHSRDFLQDLCDNADKHTFFMMVQGIVGASSPVLFIYQR